MADMRTCEVKTTLAIPSKFQWLRYRNRQYGKISPKQTWNFYETNFNPSLQVTIYFTNNVVLIV
jgi:hypothetical protein